MFNTIRSIFVLAITPLLTLITCIAAIIRVSMFGATTTEVQSLPRRWARTILYYSGVKVEVEGGGSLEPGKPYIFAANHQSQFDIFVLQGFLKADFRWMAKKELFAIPIFGYAMRRVGYVSVDRAKGREAMKSLNHAAAQIADGTSVIIFPEGTRSLDGTLQKFKSGALLIAIKAGVPIVPVAIKGTYDVLPKGKLLARPGQVKITIGHPISTNHLKSSQRQELAVQLHDEIARLMNS